MNRPIESKMMVLIALASLASASLTRDALAQESRYAEVYAQRVALQNNMKESLETTLRRIAHPYDVLATVEVKMTGIVTESVQKETQPGMEMKMESKKAVKLPGLPQTNLPNAKTDSPNISFKVPTHEKVEVRRELNALVENIAVRLYIEEGIPEEQLEQVKKAAVEIAGLVIDRGDTLDVQMMSPVTAQRETGVHAIMMAQQSVWLACITFIIATIILSLAIARRRAAAAGTTQLVGQLSGGGAAEGRAAEDEDDELETAVPALAAAAAGELPVVGELRAFEFIPEVPDDHLVEVLGMVRPEVVATILDQVPLKPGVVRELFDSLDDGKRFEVIKILGHNRVVPMSDVRAMEKEAREALQTVQSRMKLGSTVRVADVLGEAPEAAMQAVLERLAQDDPELGEKVRKSMVLFEDLATFERPLLRQVVASVDPTTIVRALQGSENGLTNTIKGAVSKRLQRIIEAEEEAMGEVSQEDVEKARRSVEIAMRRIARAARHPGAMT